MNLSAVTAPEPSENRSKRGEPARKPCDFDADAIQLLKRCMIQADEEAWREFVSKYHERILAEVRAARRRLPHRPLADGPAEDMAQEVYCRLLLAGRRRRIFRGRSEAELTSYLRRVVNSAVVDARREICAEKRGPGLEVAWTEWQLPATALRSGEDDPERLLLDREARRRLFDLCRDALGRQVDATKFRIARRAILDGWSSREIAAELQGQMAVSGIDTVVCRLRRRLAARGFDLPRRERSSRQAREGVGCRRPIAQSRVQNQARPRSGIRSPVR